MLRDVSNLIYFPRPETIQDSQLSQLKTQHAPLTLVFECSGRVCSEHSHSGMSFQCPNRPPNSQQDPDATARITKFSTMPVACEEL
jgi:hypothetical protein